MQIKKLFSTSPPHAPPIYSFTDPRFNQLLNHVGLALIAVSFLYLVAANWFMLAHWLQLAIPQCLLFACGIASVFLKQQSALRQTIDTIAGLMIGLSLAVIGQVYQTGADSYLLFGLWSVLLLPWLYRPNIGIFSLLSVTSYLTIYLFFEQTYNNRAFYYLVDLSLYIWLLILFAICLKFYARLRLVFLAFFAYQSIFWLWKFLSHDNYFFLFLGFLLPIVTAVYFYLKKDQLGTSLSVAIIGIDLTIWSISQLVEHVQDTFSLLFLISTITFLAFASLSFLIIKLIPKGQFHIIPLAIGAWLSGLFLAILMLISWESVSLILGLIFFGAGFCLLQQYKQNFFIRQLSYCLMISGQLAFLLHLDILTELIWPSLIAQFLITCLIYYFKPHWIFFSLQLIGLYALAIATLTYFMGFNRYGYEQYAIYQIYSLYTLNYLIFSSLFFIAYYRVELHRSIFILILTVLITSTFYDRFFFSLPSDFNIYLLYILNVFPLLWFIGFVGLHLKSQLNSLTLIALTLFAVIVGYFNCFEIFIILVLLSWAIYSKDKLIYALSIITLIIMLWYLYYSLNMTFLYKSLSMLLSGLALLALAYLLSKTNILMEQTK